MNKREKQQRGIEGGNDVVVTDTVRRPGKIDGPLHPMRIHSHLVTSTQNSEPILHSTIISIHLKMHVKWNLATCAAVA